MHPNAGGPPVVVDRLCRRLAARGHRVRVITTDALAGNDSDWERAYTDGGYELDVHRARGGPFAYSSTLAHTLRTAVTKSDLVHLHTVWTYPTLRAAWACRKLGVPYLVMPHGMLDPNSVRRKRVKKWLYAKFIERPNLCRAAGMIYTHPEEERLARQTISDLPRGWIVPLAADEPPASRSELSEAFFAQHPALSGTKIVLFLGRLHPKKGLDLLIPAFARVARRVPDSRLVLVGPGEPKYAEELTAQVAANKIADRVAFLGPLAGDTKWAALAAASVFALPSYQENFAITVVEAMSVGTAVLLSRHVNIWPEVEAANAGVISELDSKQIADDLRRIVTHAGFADLLGASGRDLVRQTYHWNHTTDVAEIAYRDALTRASHADRSPGVPVRGSL